MMMRLDGSRIRLVEEASTKIQKPASRARDSEKTATPAFDQTLPFVRSVRPFRSDYILLKEPGHRTETVEMAQEQRVAIRPYAASDFEAVADLWARVNRELAPAGMEALFEQYIAAAIEGELSRLPEIFSVSSRNAFWVVETAGASPIAGTFGIEAQGGDTTELRRMYIDACWRGRGLAQRMLRTAEEMARKFGFSRMIVSTADIQRAAYRFYTKSGFVLLRSESAEAMTTKQAGGGLLRHYFEKAL
jgi:GNAT superfamily N-acetyltransferase